MVSFFSKSSANNFYRYLDTTQWLRVLAALAVIMLAIGYGVGFAVMGSKARTDADDDYNRRIAIFQEWQMEIVSQFTRAESLAATAAAYAIPNAVKPMNHSGTAASRIVITNPNAYEGLCEDVQRANFHGIYTVVILAGGVTSQVCPANSFPVGVDTMASPTYITTYNRMFEVQGPVVTGPVRMDLVAGAISINAWFPIFVNSTTENRTRATFWGATTVVVELTRYIAQKNMHGLVAEHGLDFIMWWEEYDLSNGKKKLTASNLIGTSAVNDASAAAAMRDGMRLTLPVAEPGKSTFFALYPRGGPVKSDMSTDTILIIVFVVIAIDLCVLLLIGLALYTQFFIRHRHAPADGSTMFVAALTLRGAQPIADRSPMESVRMFTTFTAEVRKQALMSKCYPICEIGDRTVYVVAKSASAIVSLSRSSVFDVSILGNAAANGNGGNIAALNGSQLDDDDEGTAGGGGTARARTEASVSQGATSYSRTARSNRTGGVTAGGRSGGAGGGRNDNTVTRDDANTSFSSSFIGAAICRPSAAIHTATARCAFDPIRNVYFYGNALHIGRLCGALDTTKGGEVGWTVAVADSVEGSDECQKVLESVSVSTHIVSEGNDVVLHVASLWKDTGDERDNEDPSTAMAALNDAYVKKMTAIVSQGTGGGNNDGGGKRHGKHGRNGGKNNGGGSSGKNSSDKSADATSISRVATLLHIAVLNDAKMPLDVIRRIATEEKGSIVSGSDGVLLIAFNLLTPGGHHQIRAADTVVRLRAAIPQTPFVASIHFGRVNALIIDGLVLCSGETVTIGKALLMSAVKLRQMMNAPPPPPPPTNNNNKCNMNHNSASDDNSVRPFSDNNNHKNHHGGQQHDHHHPAITLNEDEENIVHQLTVDADAAIINGMCLLYAVSELSSSYECEAVTVLSAADTRNPFTTAAAHSSMTSATPTPLSASIASPLPPSSSSRVAYRLAHRKSGKNGDDEWMYCLKNDEDMSPFAAVNAVFSRIAVGDFAEARRLWGSIVKHSEADALFKSNISPVAISSVEGHLLRHQ